jgi:hypothetical protein
MAGEKIGETSNLKDALKPHESMASEPHALMQALDALRDFVTPRDASGKPIEGARPGLQLRKPANREEELQMQEAKRLLEMKDRLRAELPAISDLLSTRTSANVNDINKFLKEKGFDLELKDQGADGVYVATVFKQQVEWLEKGSKQTIGLPDGREVPGVGWSGSRRDRSRRSACRTVGKCRESV